MKLLLIMMLSALTFSAVHGQTNDQKAASKAEKISKELGLTAQQNEKIKNVFLDEEKKTAELKAKYSKASERSQYHKEAKLLREQTEKNIIFLLNATQKTKYESLHSEDKKEKK